MRPGSRRRLVVAMVAALVVLSIVIVVVSKAPSPGVARVEASASFETISTGSPEPRTSAAPQGPTNPPVEEATPAPFRSAAPQGPTNASTASASPAPSPSMAPLESARICIDPGHQRRRDSETEAVAPWSDAQKARTSSGTEGVQSGVPEYEYTLRFSQELAQALRARGAEVILTRESHDVTLSNIERAEIGNAFGADVVLRIHCDGSSDETRQGIGLFVADRADPEGVSRAYAQALLECLVDSTGARSGGVRASDEYTGLNWSRVPAILVELGYMSNAQEDERLQTEAYRGQLIEGIVQWCEAQFGGRP